MELCDKTDHDWRRCDECRAVRKPMVVLSDNSRRVVVCGRCYVVVCGQCLRKALRLLRKKVKRA